ncbi:unnamed protein product [Effrenium voratum]|uniref:Uncharacterized protein n=1 Tax=Effrenium voratum TaxID=2562239 RepID=A0AA36JJW7_9DINO|nr:unnamed protein product [Effrenium voratum]
MEGQAFHFTALEREAFRPPPLQAKAGWKTLEAELQYQSQFCHDKLQKDLDALHAQVLSEVHRAVAQELQKVCSNMEGLHNQVVRDVATLSGTARQEVQSQKELLERRTAESSEAMVEAREVPKELHVRVRTAGGHDLFSGKLPAEKTVADLKEELRLVLPVPHAQQRLASLQHTLQDGTKLEEIFALQQEEIELYGMLRSSLSQSTPSPASAHDLDCTLYVEGGLLHLRAPQDNQHLGFYTPKLSLALPQLPLDRRIFVESVQEGSWAAEVRAGDELLKVMGRDVASLSKGEFGSLVDRALWNSGEFQFHRSSLDPYFGADGSVFCCIVSMEDEELLSLRVPQSLDVGALKQLVERFLRIPRSCQQLIQDHRPLEDEEPLPAHVVGVRLALLRLGLFTQEEFGAALKAGLDVELGLAFCDAAFLATGRVAVAAVEPARWSTMLRFLGDEDLETPSDGQVVAVLPRDDYDALLRLGPLNFLFRAADVPRAQPPLAPRAPPEANSSEAPEAAAPEAAAPEAAAPEAAAPEEAPVVQEHRRPRAKPRATG